MRLFIAINLNKKMKERLIGMQEELYAQGLRGNVTKPENMHLTLAFIGDYPDPDEVIEIIEGISFRPFALKIEGKGAFGDLWWAGLEKSEPLQALVKKLRHRLADAGIPFDRKKFTPHITLVRKASKSEEWNKLRVPGSEMMVKRVSLMQSEQRDGKRIYTEIFAI